MEEIWNPIAGYEGLYEVSSLGNIRSLNYAKQLIIKNLSCSPKREYLRVFLYKEQSRKEFHIHVLVANTFLGSCPLWCEINHKSGNKHENGVSNLEYVTRSENRKHAFRIGLQSNKGSKHSQARLDENKVLRIKKLIKENFSQNYIAKLFEIHPSAISKINSGHRWSHVI